jgi:hypothetical protein
MEQLTQTIFGELAGLQGSPCISIYMSTHQAGMEVNELQDAIRFKKTLRDISAELQNDSGDSRMIEHLLKPAWELYEDDRFWREQSQGLAVFLANGNIRLIKLPYRPADEYNIGPAFLLTPLLPALNDQTFFLLTLSKHDSKFYEGDAFGLRYVNIPGLPNGIEDVVHLEEKQDFQLFRQGAGGKGAANFHGHGEGQLEDKANLVLYFQEVDRTLFAERLHDQQAPLVLAGVDYLLPIYRSVNRYKFITERGLTGNHDYQDEHTLFNEALPIVQPYFDIPAKKALENYYNQVATALTSSIPETVIPASYYGQVSDLFICKDTHIWGSFDDMNNRLEIHENRQPGDVCLLSQAAVKAWQNGSGVYLLEKERMPKDSVIAAMLRYE